MSRWHILWRPLVNSAAPESPRQLRTNSSPGRERPIHAPPEQPDDTHPIAPGRHHLAQEACAPAGDQLPADGEDLIDVGGVAGVRAEARLTAVLGNPMPVEVKGQSRGAQRHPASRVQVPGVDGQMPLRREQPNGGRRLSARGSASWTARHRCWTPAQSDTSSQWAQSRRVSGRLLRSAPPPTPAQRNATSAEALTRHA